MKYESKDTWFEHNRGPSKETMDALRAEQERNAQTTVSELCDRIIECGTGNTIASSAIGRELSRRGYALDVVGNKARKVEHGPQCGCSVYICAACLGLEPYP